MAKKKKLRSSRDVEYNYAYNTNGTINSAVTTVSSSRSAMNVTLLNYNDAIVKTGHDIKTEENKNPNTPLANNTLYHGKIDTETLNDTTEYSIYGAPHKMVLDDRQQYNNCGVDSVLNILVMAGLKTIKNQNSTETAFTKELWNLGLIEDSGILGRLDRADGGSVPINYVDFLNRYGISSTAYASTALGGSSEGADETTTLENVAQVVKNGGAAILAVSSDILWGTDATTYTLDHAVTVTGVVYDNSNNLVGFYIHDTGLWMTRYISVDDLKKCTMYDDTSVWWKTQTGVFGTVTEEGIKANTYNLNLSGSKYDDTLTGNESKNVIRGYNGNDTIFGKGGDDTLYGGNGNDYIDGGEGNNRVYGENGNDLILTASGNDYIRGGNNDDKIDAGAGNDTIYGDNGNDIIVGGAGNDYIRGGNGNDWIFANEGVTISDNLNYSDLSDNWVLDQLSSKAIVDGKNTIYGDNGNDHIFGGNYDDIINGGNGNDVIYARGGNDVIYGGNGNDIIDGGDGIDVIYGGNNNDTIYGGKGDDRIFAQSGNDTIDGGEGNDVIICGSGRDRVIIKSGGDIDSVSSSSGSVTFALDKSALDMDYTYSSDYGTVKTYYNYYNDSDDFYGFEYQGFFNSSRNKYQSATIEDSEGKSYKMSATRSNGRIRVANTKGNNIMFSTSMGNNTVTTSNNNDIVWMRGGNNTITYTGGRDKYYSGGDESYKSGRHTLHTEGDDTYIVTNFNKDSYLSINDSISNDNISYNASDNDVLRINTVSNINLFFDITKDGLATDNDNLYIISSDSEIADYSSLFNEKGSGYISITDYFSQGNDVSKYIGDGYIENISVNNNETNIDATIDTIKSNVASWLNNAEHAYDSVASALANADKTDISSLLACFNTSNVQ